MLTVPHRIQGKVHSSSCLGEKCDLECCQRSQKHPNVIITLRTPEVRQNDALYKLKSKIYHDKRRNVRKFGIAVGDRILMKNKRTDTLSPIPGKVIKIHGNALTARFDDGKVFVQDKSHFKIARERSCAERRERVRGEETFQDNILNQSRSIRVRETSCRIRLIVTKQIS